nr:GSTsigma1e protein [Diaphanosoma celebensis]
MPTYKLHYFNMRARGELSRLIFAHANVPYEDCRYEMSEWAEQKSKMPFGQLPVLEVDGKMLAQSHTMGRYLARKFGLAGKDEWEQAQADMYVDCVNDIMNAARASVMETDPEKQKELFQTYIGEQVVPHVQLIEKQLRKNGTGYLVGSSVTWADLAYYSFFSFLLERCPDMLKDTPHFKRLLSTVENIPQIKKWIETRPKTPM